jgi:transcriptional regulator with XRE-family HTH domain
MNADVLPPPEARLITEMREKPPRMSMSEAARRAGISLTRWRQLENGFRPFRGTSYPETGPAQTIAKMARVVGVTPRQLTDAGRPDAAAELEAMARQVEVTGAFTRGQREGLARRVRRDAPPGD